MARKTARTAGEYEKATTGRPIVEHPDDPKPESKTALRARRVAIREGRCIARPRDQYVAEGKRKAREEAAKARAKAKAEAAKAKAEEGIEDPPAGDDDAEE